MRQREDLEEEQHKRRIADSIINRAKPGGIRGDFPSVRDVDKHVEKLAGDAIRWTEEACAIGRSHAALPATVQSVLTNTFLVCKEEVTRCFRGKTQSLSDFLGSDEPVELSGGNSMKLNTQYVLYECLRQNFQTIVPLDPERIGELAREVQQRCGGAEDGDIVSDVINGDRAWPSFANLVKKYIMVFVEVSTQ